MARARREDDTEQVNIRINKSLINRIRARFHDPFTGKPKYGAINSYFEMLAQVDMKAHEGIIDLIDKDKQEKPNE